MSAQRFSSELKEQVVLEVVEKDRTIAEVARSYDLVPQTVGNWVKKWRKDHPESVDSEVGAEQSAENRRLRAELREARMEIELREKRLPSSRRSPGRRPVRVHPPRRRKLPDHHDVPLSESMAGIKQNGILGRLLRDSWLASTEGLV
ncbi:transposase [Actinomyces israelii]|uniref:Transposase n=1 Tax=Actinomyces israelii TaxID=1659 RepID=A0ABT4I8E6_9ACTO|nr:transposase [Actinomyces israelii]MCZ0857373.1 transposase [Actinomyces israelii]